MTHWHADPVTHHMTSVPGDVDPDGCCKGSAKWADVLGPGADEQAPGVVGAALERGNLTWRRPVCPECAQGKHQNCAHMALDERSDDITDCHCEACKTDAAERAAITEQNREEWNT